MGFQICVNCDKGVPGHPLSHRWDCPRPKYNGQPDQDSPAAKQAEESKGEVKDE